MKRLVTVSALLFVMSGIGCKGETTVKDNPQTLEELGQCEANLKEKVEYINTLNNKITELEGSASGESSVVVNIEGEVMTISSGASKGPHSGPGDVKGNAKDAELYKAFVSQLKRSRGAIKKCYQHALKKNSALSSRTITLNIGVDYKTSGAVRKTRFSPRVSDQFNTCMNGVAGNWKLPAMPKPVSFNYKQTLTPE